ncbi:hypothetical protein [Sphingomonas nostoxanthinifaciens]|uniref:hypothetical protein n=1 Tax=Sphingomonas nostoxanthinifaciens TaxID=2872652 RepID=UPI001CC1D92B|nr:hypothetical protein [Sphingomonas nostoxanthinifaciens]UAK24317.1 hypothetical protein K8P63_18715 [Sphingomonas nostoxanthinifaciens]
MASTPDAHPDSVPPRPSDSPEQVSSGGEPARENIEDTPGTDGGTAGTGGTNHRGDRDITS